MSLQMKKSYSLFIGRYQPFHDGHEALIRSVLDEGKDVCIALRDTNISDMDPYSVRERVQMIAARFEKELAEERILIAVLPDITEVCYGRKVGWGMREIRLDEELEKISATDIRAKGFIQ
jgi:nicotinamide mononucleotide adenylyltransferase